MDLRQTIARGRAGRAVYGTAYFFILTLWWGSQGAPAATEAEKEASRVRQERFEKLESLHEASEESGTVEEGSEEQIRRESEQATTVVTLLEDKRKELAEASPSERKLLMEEIKSYEKELLRTPKRDRFGFGGDFDLTYDNNVSRNIIRSEEGDTLFRISPFIELDLGGRKTDFRAEFRAVREYNAKVSEGKDKYNLEARVRAGRKIGKTTVSLNDRLNYEVIRDTTLDDEKKRRFDNSHRVSLNHELNRKLSINLEFDYSRRDFPHETFDQDGDYSWQLDPNLFFQMTPKTRFSVGYRLKESRVITESSDQTLHEFRAGYFGKVTGKSSLQIDLSHTFKAPDSARAARSDLTVASAGYIWQATPKTSVRFLYSNSFEHSLSDGGSSATLTKTTTRTSSDTFSLSVRFRPFRKLSVETSSDISHSHTKTRKTSEANTRTRTWSFPFQIAADYQLARWIRLRISYTYRHQIGNEESDQHRAHTLFVGSNVSF